MEQKRRNIVILVTSLVLVAGMIVRAYPEEGWERAITVTVAGAENRLSFGQKTDATDGCDGGYDVPPMLGGNITAYFSDEGGNYWRDIKAFTRGTKTWVLHIESPLPDRDVTLTWGPQLPPGMIKIMLNDASAGTSVDMQALHRYAYRNTGPRDLMIEVTY